MVSPIRVKETMEKMGLDTAGDMSAENTARAYAERVEGSHNGEVLDVSDFAQRSLHFMLAS